MCRSPRVEPCVRAQAIPGVTSSAKHDGVQRSPAQLAEHWFCKPATPAVTDATTRAYDNKPPTPRSGAQIPGISGIQDQQLRAIVNAWPKLPEAVRAGIGAMVAVAIGHE